MTEKSERVVTGRTVLVCLITFFGVIGAMNAVLIKAATSTFGGVETENAYKAGLNFGRDITAARMQNDMHWNVGGKISLDVHGIATAELTVNDAGGRVIDNLEINGLLAHPTNRKLDRAFALQRAGSGVYRGSVDASPGQWDYIIEIDRNSERAFQSKTRIILK